jgi:hypothetical protein
VRKYEKAILLNDNLHENGPVHLKILLHFWGQANRLLHASVDVRIIQ